MNPGMEDFATSSSDPSDADPANPEGISTCIIFILIFFCWDVLIFWLSPPVFFVPAVSYDLFHIQLFLSSCVELSRL
ncbi:hypothetical protein LINPERHAP1_LOCUS40296, partial [Linum perenne]